MTVPLVLVLTHPADVHAEAVIAHLRARGVPVARMDTALIGTHVPVSARLSRAGLTGRLGEVVLEQATCVWHRRPSQFAVADAESVAELRAGVGGVLACLPYLNHPVDMAAAHKPRQLVLATRAGLAVPESLVASHPGTAAGMADRFGGQVVVKPISPQMAGLVSEGDRSGWRRRVHLTQQRIAKAYDVRVSIVDDATFAVRIDSPHLDWRRELGSCHYQAVDTPPTVASGLRRLLRLLRLRYAAADFAVDADGRWWFLEANPNGQWLWLEYATEIPVSAAVATALATPTTNGSTDGGATVPPAPAARSGAVTGGTAG